MLERFDPSRSHEPLARELFDFPDVDRAPGTCLPPGREANAIAYFVNRFADPVNPAEAERFVNGLWPCHAGFAAVHFVETYQQFGFFLVVFLQPLPEVGLL